MFELSIIVVLLIAAAIFFKTQKKSQQETIQQDSKATELKAQTSEPQLTAETKTGKEQPVFKQPENQPNDSAKRVASSEHNQEAAQEKPSSLLLPQDSVLRRHYLSYLCALIEQSLPPRPADSVLNRHYLTIVESKLEQALSSKEALNELLEYSHVATEAVEKKKVKTVKSQQIIEPAKVAAESTKLQNAVKVQIPEDSILRRHYFAHLRANAESNLPPKPMDSVLKRHWQTLSDDAFESML